MSEINYNAYALKSFTKTKENPTIEDFEQNGFLLFKTEEKADRFLEICENMNKKGLSVHYEKYGPVQIISKAADYLQNSSSFYVTNLKEHAYLEESSN